MVIHHRALRPRVYTEGDSLFGKSSQGSGPNLVGRNAFASFEHRIQGRRVRIGSAAGNDLILPHRTVSARHAVIRRALGSWYVRDLGSANGTFLNGQRIATEQPLRVGDEIRFGAARFAIVAAEKPATSTLKYVGAVVGLILLAGAGYLGVNFVQNWENLEKLSSSGAPQEAASRASRAASTAALPGASVSAAAARSSVAAARPAVAAPEPAWLAAINEYRAGVALAPVAEDPKLSAGDRKHAMYVVKNYEDKVGLGHLIGAEMHEEEKGNPWYSPEGQTAGIQSDVNQLWGPERPPSVRWALDNWLDGPFHRLWILNPGLRRVGYGEFCEKRYCVAALDLGSGADPPRGASPLPMPIQFPPDKSITTRNAFSGEWPSPLTSCPGYRFPGGLPITIQLGAMVDAKLGEYEITREGHGVESCGIDARTYQNPVNADQERGRSILSQLGAAIIIPRYPLKPGRYSVTMTVNDRAYQWSFAIATAASEAGEPAAVSTSHAEAAEEAPKSSRTDDFEAALRRGYAVASKSDAESRTEYGDESKREEAVAAAKNAALEAANAMASAKNLEFKRSAESAFPQGPGEVAPAGPAQWLSELNRARAAVELPPVAEDPALSDGDRKHAQYVAMNCPSREAVGDAMHHEDSSKPGYTPEGLAAARESDVMPYWFPATAQAPSSVSPLTFLNVWLAAPFHRAALLYPQLHKTGFGQFCHQRACAGALDTAEALKPSLAAVPLAQPILFPPPKYPVALAELSMESPDPTTACPGYALPVGLPITIQIGLSTEAKLSSYAVTQDSKPVEACGIDATTYTNPNAEEQNRARERLQAYGEVVIIPRKPLQRGATYQVSARVNDHPYQWSFTVSP